MQENFTFTLDSKNFEVVSLDHPTPEIMVKFFNEIKKMVATLRDKINNSNIPAIDDGMLNQILNNDQTLDQLCSDTSPQASKLISDLDDIQNKIAMSLEMSDDKLFNPDKEDKILSSNINKLNELLTRMSNLKQ